MSDHPPWDQNLERQIPGLREAIANLANVASNSGFRIATIVFTDHQQQPGAQAPPTRITFQSQLEQPTTLATTTQAVERWASPHPQLPQQWHPSQTAALPVDTAHLTREPTGEQRNTSLRTKRDSAAALEGDSATSAQFGKRKRFSDPPIATQGAQAGAFWGTVLEERPRITTSMMPPPRGGFLQPPLVGPSQPSAQPMEAEEQLRQGTIAGPVPSEEEEGERVKRTSTFPGLRLQSPSAQRLPHPVHPSLQDPLFSTGRESRERYSSPPGIGPSLQQPERRSLRRTASQILGRLSPFGAGAPSPGTARAAMPPPSLQAEGQQYRARGPGLLLFGAPQRRTQEMLGQQTAGDTVHTQMLPTMQRPQPYEIQLQPSGTAATQQSGSSSGVSYAQPSRTTASPPTEGSRLQTGSSSRGKRGRRSGSGADREQGFECEHCGSKFRRKSDKNRHVRVVHEKSRPFVCPICEKTFGEKSNMLKHRASVHDDVRIFRCPYCDQSFSQRGLCDAHVKTVHDKKQAKYFCEHCGLPFSRKVQLNEHYEQEHSEFMASHGRQYTSTAISTLGIASASTLAQTTAMAPTALARTTSVVPTTPMTIPPALLAVPPVQPTPAVPRMLPTHAPAVPPELRRDERGLIGEAMQGAVVREHEVGSLLPLGTRASTEAATTTGPAHPGVSLPPPVPRSQYQQPEEPSRQRSFQGDSGT